MVQGAGNFIVQVNFEVQADHVAAALGDSARRQVPFMTARLMTALGGDVQSHLRRQLPVAFDRPTPFTERGVFLERAEKANPTATVYFPDSQAQQGRAEREYIRPGADGGARAQKKTEYLLTQMGWLPAGWVTTPGKSIALDGYGNMPGSYYKQIIRSLFLKNTKGPAKPLPAAAQRRVARMGVASEFFAVAPGANSLAKGGGWLPPGVYKRSGRHGETLQQYLKFVRGATYKQRLNVKAEAQVAITANLDKRWSEVAQDLVTRFRPK